MGLLFSQYRGFSLQWLLLFWSTSSRACGLQLLRCISLVAKHVGSSWTKDRTCVLCIDRQIHRGKLYIIFHTDIVSLTDSDPWPGLPWCFSGKTNKQTNKQKTAVCQDRRPGFHPWVRMIPLSRKWQPAPVFLLGKFHGQRSLALLQLMGWQRVGCNLMTQQQQQQFLALGWHSHSGV